MWVCWPSGMGYGAGWCYGARWWQPAFCGDALWGLSWHRRGLGKTLLWGHPLQTHCFGFCRQSSPSPTLSQTHCRRAGTSQVWHGMAAGAIALLDSAGGTGVQGTASLRSRAVGWGRWVFSGSLCRGSDGAEHRGPGLCQGRSLCYRCSASSSPAPQGRSCSRCTEPEYTVFAQSPRLNKMFMHASAPTNILAGLHEACSLPQLQLRRGQPQLRQGWEGSVGRSLQEPAGLCMAPSPGTPALSPCAPSSTTRGFGCCPATLGANGSCWPL